MSNPTPTILKVGILIVSTTAAKRETQDLTTDLLRKSFEKANESNSSTQWEIMFTDIVVDHVDDIKDAIKVWIDRAHLVVTSGGTGFAENDKTPEVCANRRRESILWEESQKL